MIPNPSQEAIRLRLVVPDGNGDNDDTEIVIVSDTVRQRRSRTPSSSTSIPNDAHIKDSKLNTNQMPDLLPRTFHLDETSDLFAQVNNAQNVQLLKNCTAANGEKVSVVEVRETNLSTPKRVINTYRKGDSLQEHTINQISNTCSILKSVNYLKPSSVETVHIIDVTSEPSDSETRSLSPNFDDQQENKQSSSDDDREEYETGEPSPHSSNKMRILKRQISYEENRKLLQKDRDLLKDSEQINAPPKPQRKRLTPTLKDILSATTDRDSFYSNDKEAFDEPLIFSDDEECNHIDGPSTERFNRFTVLIDKTLKNENQNNPKLYSSQCVQSLHCMILIIRFEIARMFHRQMPCL